MGIKRIIDEESIILKGFLKSFQKPKCYTNTPIDFVVAWVDGSDPAWLEQRAQVLGEDLGKKEDNHKGRYQAWDSFKYWFRAVETYAPWVRKVFLITWGHLPSWLNTDCPKLQIVRHEDFIPAEYLPTFNSNTIEMNMFRIPELSENFVYFNDDMYLCRPVDQTEFFIQSKPRHTAVAIPWVNHFRSLPEYLFYNVYGEVNKANDISVCIRKTPDKWFSHLYGRRRSFNRFPLQNGAIPGMLFTHMGVPFLKSSMQETWNKYEKACVETSLYKQRDIHQVTHQLFSIEDIISGNFYPSKDDWGYHIKITDYDLIRYAFSGRKRKMFCLFDDAYTDDQVSEINTRLNEVFSLYLKEKSAFEK